MYITYKLAEQYLSKQGNEMILKFSTISIKIQL